MYSRTRRGISDVLVTVIVSVSQLAHVGSVLSLKNLSLLRREKLDDLRDIDKLLLQNLEQAILLLHGKLNK